MRKSLVLTLVAGLALGFMAPSYAAEAAHHSSHASKPAAAVGMVDINKADATQLMTLKGVGKKRAEAIIAYRQAHGSFQSVDDLKNVKGLSQKVIDSNKDHLTIG